MNENFKKTIFDRIKIKHSEYASWAIWANQGEKPKSNIGDLTILDPSINKNLFSQLKPNIILVGLNFSRDKEHVSSPFANFHDSDPVATDFKIRYALKGSPYWGAYMTDIIKDHTELDSKEVMQRLKKNPSLVKKNIKKFLEELNDLEVENPTIIAFGYDVYSVLARNLIKYKIFKKIPHYAARNFNNKEDYRSEVQSILKF